MQYRVLYILHMHIMRFIMKIIDRIPKRIYPRADLDPRAVYTTYIVALFLCYRLA